MLRFFTFFFSLTLCLQAEETKVKQPPIEKTGETSYRIGQISFDQKSRTITFPAYLESKDHLLEYLLVHENGKIHETLFTTTVSATNLNIALKLLHYKESPELFQTRDENLLPTGQYPDVPTEIKKAARITLIASWKEKDKVISRPVNDLIYNNESTLSMPAGPWLYSGSYIHEGRFASETYGNIIAIFSSENSMINWPGEHHQRDDIWAQYTERLPAEGTPITLKISPHN